MSTPSRLELDALADAVAQKLLGRIRGGDLPIPIPKGEPDPERPQLPWDPLDEGPLGIYQPRSLRIAGMELTQSVQHHGAAGPSYGLDNSVPLVALKTLVVRVYPCVRSGWARPDALTGSRVTGELVLSIGSQVVYRTGPTRAQGVRIGPQSNLSRTLWDEELTYSAPGPHGLLAQLQHLNCSLNFVVPGWYCRRGRIHVAVRIWRVDAAASDVATATTYTQFLDVSAPRVCLVRVNWTDSAGAVHKPADADMLSTLRTAERMLPWPYFETMILGGELTKSGDYAVTSTSGDCNTAWSKLVAELALTRIFTSLFGLGQIVIGLVPAAAIPAGGGTINSGCGGDAIGTFVGLEPTIAHELGHLYGRPHVAVPGDSDNDTDYPAYDGTGRSAGEVGVDTGTWPPTLYDPQTTADIMSYRKPPRWATRWVSPYTYQKLLDLADHFQHVPADPRRVRPLLILELRLNRHFFSGGDGSGLQAVHIKRAFRVEAPGRVEPPIERATSPISVDLLDANHRIVATHHCTYRRPRPSGGGCGHTQHVPLEREPYLDLIEAIEWPDAGVAALAFHRGGEPVATMTVGEPPRVEIQGPEFRDDLMVVRVRAEHPRETPAVVVLFTNDDGLSWQPVGFDPPGPEITMEIARFPGGARCRFRAIATGELQSATADTEPFELAHPPRRIHLWLPSSPCGTAPGRVAMSALLDTRGHGALRPHEIRWQSSLQGEIGAGYDLTAELIAGEHVITVTAPDGLGGMLSERGIIIVGG